MFLFPSLSFKISNNLPLYSLQIKQKNTTSSHAKTRKEKLQKNTQDQPRFAKVPCNVDKGSTFICPLQDPGVDSVDQPLARWFADSSAILSCLKSCASLEQVKCLHSVSLRVLDSSFPFIGNNFISSYVQFSELVEARKVFDTMLERNVVTWTAMLNGYVKLGCFDEALDLFVEMVKNNVKPNSLTFVCVLKLCGKVLDFELGRQIHADVIKGHCRNMIVDSALLHFYAQCGDLHSTSVVFTRCPQQDVVSWTTMITAYAQNGDGGKAISLFAQMHQQGFVSNEFTVSSVLKACSERKALKFGKQLHGAIMKGMCAGDIYVYSCLVTMYGRCGEISDARTVFNLMPRRNTITWTSMIAAYVHNGFGQEAIHLFQRMKRRRISANNLTIVSILNACGLLRSLDLGKEVHGQILRNLAQNNIHIGSTLIWFYCRCGEFSYALRVLESMPMRDVVSWTALISGYSNLENGSDALKFMNDMLREGVHPNPYTYSSALKACARQEDVRHGKLLHASANKNKSLSNVYVSSALMDMYFKCGCITEASRVFDAMPERNLVSWKTMITGYAKCGRCSEALQLMYRMQAEGFHIDDFVLSAVLSSCGDIQWETEYSLTTYSHSA